MRCSFRTHLFSWMRFPGRCPGLVCLAPFRANGTMAFHPATVSTTVSTTVSCHRVLPPCPATLSCHSVRHRAHHRAQHRAQYRTQYRTLIAVPIPMPKPRYRPHALKGHRIPAQGANPGNPPGKTDPRSEGTPHRSPHRTLLQTKFWQATGFEPPPSHPRLEGCGLWASCGNRGQRTRLQWRRPACVDCSYTRPGHRPLPQPTPVLRKNLKDDK